MKRLPDYSSQALRTGQDFTADLLIDIGLTFQDVLSRYGYESFLDQASDSEFCPPALPYLKELLNSANEVINGPNPREDEREDVWFAKVYTELWIEWWQEEGPSWRFIKPFFIGITALTNSKIDFAALKKRAISEESRKKALKRHASTEELRKFCIETASEIWSGNPDDFRMGEMVTLLATELARKGGREVKHETIRNWLKIADKDGELVIPKKARTGGRPRRDL